MDEAKGELPADFEDDPVVFEVNISELPIAVFSLSGTDGIARLKEMAEDLKDVIEAITGVLEVEITGGLEREIIVEMNPDKLTYLGGVFLGLTALSLPFGVIMSGVGTISLAGVVVNNAIVLIDYINKLMARGYAAKEAIIAAGATRLRPVLLTAVTTILGLIPMVTGVSYDFRNFTLSLVSESSQWWRSMAIVVIFGLLVATFLTLVVVPVLYSLNHSLQQALRRTLQRMRETSTRA